MHELKCVVAATSRLHEPAQLTHFNGKGNTASSVYICYGDLLMNPIRMHADAHILEVVKGNSYLDCASVAIVPKVILMSSLKW